MGAIKRFIEQIRSDDPSLLSGIARLEQALATDLVYSLANQVQWRGTRDLLVPRDEVDAFASGLSPVFDIKSDSTKLESFVAKLNDRKYLESLPMQRAQEGTLCVAISYKHEVSSAAKLTKSHLEELTESLLNLSHELGVTRVQFWIDRVLSAKKRNLDRSWYEEGLLPFLVLPVIYIMGADKSTIRLIAEMDTMWINIERVAASLGRGMVSFGRRFDREALPRAGINFENARLSCFDWWFNSKMNGTAEEKFRTLLFALGNSTMLERDTYFPEDRKALLQLSQRIFNSPSAVVRVIPASNYIMRDDAIWSKGDCWLGDAEWCTSFKEDESCLPGKSLIECAAPLYQNGFKPHFRRVWISSGNAEESEWIILTRESDIPVIALVVQLQGCCAELRSTVVLDSPVEFLEFSAGVLRNVDSGPAKDAASLIDECLRRSGLVNEDESWSLIEGIAADGEVLLRNLSGVTDVSD